MTTHLTSSSHMTYPNETAFIDSETVANVTRAIKPLPRDALVDLSVTATVEQVFNILLAHDVLAVPVYHLENETKTYIAMVSGLDLLKLLHKHPDKHVLQLPLAQAIDLTTMRANLATVRSTDTLAYLIELFSKHQVHHVLVQDDSVLLSQMDVVSYLQKNNHRLGRVLDLSPAELMKRSRARRQPPSTWQVTPIPLKTTALDAFLTMAEAGVSALPIVDNQDYLVSDLSPENLRGLNHDRFDTLRRPVLMYLKESQGELDVPLTCHDRFTLSQIMTAFALRRVHRLWWRDDDGHVKGVITLTDLLGAL